jgi:hypothetical protein
METKDVVSLKIRKDGYVDLFDAENNVINRLDIVDLVRFWLKNQKGR